jgi:hypothetical protein
MTIPRSIRPRSVFDYGLYSSDLPYVVASTSDDLSAVIADAEDQGGREIRLLPGTYAAPASTVELSIGNVSVVAPWGGVTIESSGARAIFSLLPGAERVRFSGIKFDLSAHTTYGSHAVLADDVTNLVIDHCELIGGSRTLEIRNSGNVHIVDNVGHNAGEWPIYVAGCARVWITGNECYSNGLDGIKVGSVNTIRTGTITVTNGSPNVSGVGTLFTSELSAGDYILISGGSIGKIQSITNDTALVLTANWAYGSAPGTAYYGDPEVTIADLIVAENICYSNTSAGINVDSNSLQRVTVANNICHDNGAYGINIKQVYFGVTVKDIQVTGNVCTTNTGGGVTLQRNDTTNATMTDVFVTNNLIRQTNAAACLRLQSVDQTSISSNFIHQTGVNGDGVLIVDSDSCVFQYNDIRADEAVVFDNQAAAHACAGNIVQNNQLTNINTGNGAALVTFKAQAGGALGNHTNNVIRDNRMAPDVFTTLDTSTTGTKVYGNVIGSGTAAPAIFGHKGDIYMNDSPDSTEYVGWIAVTTANPASWKGFGAIA